MALNCSVFDKIAFWQTDEEVDSIDALSRSRCNERLLNRMLENMKLSDNVV